MRRVPRAQELRWQQPRRHHPAFAGQPDESDCAVRARWLRAELRRLTRSLCRTPSYLSGNILSGTIPASLGSLTSLVQLCVRG